MRAVRVILAVLCLPLLAGGCCRGRQELRDTLMRKPPAGATVSEYRVGCPDVVSVSIEGHPEWSAQREVEANGCINLGSLGGVRVEGLTALQIRSRIAGLAGVPIDRVDVRLDDFRSQQVYLFGEVTGEQRAVAYQGPETVADLLRRAGGITPDGAPSEVRVVRHKVMEDAEPEVFQVNLDAVLMKGDNKSNIVIQPYDQIYVPETKQARVGKCLHPWLRPVGRFVTGD